MKSILKIFIPVLLFTGLTIIYQSCKKELKLPVLTTSAVTSITQTTAASGGNITDDGGADVTSRGVCWSISQNPTTGSNKTSDGIGTGSFTSNITGLTPGTTYYLRAYAVNSVGTAYGNEVSFPSSPVLLATVTTSVVSSISSTTAVCGGSISSDGGGTITSRGVCWSQAQNPTTADNKTTDGSGTGTFISNLTSLIQGATYYVRAYAVNSAGTAYGAQQSFRTSTVQGDIIFNPNLTYGTVSDIDGNIYKTIQIGTQVWMAENLKTTKLNDNTPVPNTTDLTAWVNLTTPGYCWYNNDAQTFKNVYGALYNWYAVGTGKLCPSGWHVPSDGEWATLQTYLGGADVAGGKMKETGTSHWQTPNEGATNESGFTGLPGAERDFANDFGNGSWIGVYGQWWSSTFEFNGHYYNYELFYGTPSFMQGSLVVQMGLSVRCLKD